MANIERQKKDSLPPIMAPQLFLCLGLKAKVRPLDIQTEVKELIEKRM